jgi:hypothetical protein
MKRRTSISLGALLGVMVATLAQGANLRYQGSGDYTNILAISGTIGWYNPSVPGTPTTLPGSADEIRFNYGGAVVTLTTVAPDVLRLRTAVDEPGDLVVESGGRITSTSTLVVGYNAGKLGRLTVKTNGVVNANAVMEVGRQGIGILTIDGGTVNCITHVWVGDSAVPSAGTIIITNGGVLNVNLAGTPNIGMLGLGTIDAVNTSGGTGTMKVTDGSVANLFNIDGSGRSIMAGCVLDISGSGMVTFPGDKTSVLTNYYTTTGKIIAFGGTGTVVVDYNVSNPGKTTLKAVGGYVAPTDCTWIATSGPGFWSDGTNWSCGYAPASVTVVTLDGTGTIPCVVNAAASADSIDMGTNGPGGTLIVTNTGILTCGGTNANYIGNNNSALMVVADGAAVTFGSPLRIGFDVGANGTLRMDGGTVSVGGMFDLGYQGGTGTAQIKGGTLNLATFDDYASMGAAGLLDITGTGKVILNGNHSLAMAYYISTGQITNSSGASLLVDYGIIHSGKTTVYPANLALAPEQAVWNPAYNLGDPDGSWNLATNWTTATPWAPLGMVPGNVTVVTFHVPDAIPCTITNAAMAGYISMGDSAGPGGTLIITNGGSLTTGNGNWSAVGYSSNALMMVEAGSSASFGYHLWVGLDPAGDGTLIIDGGTVSVGGMFGLGWQGGKGTCIITNGGILNLSQLHPTDSIKTNNSVLNLNGTSTVLINANYVSAISNYVATGKIIANGGTGKVAYGFDSGANKTIVQVAPARQSVTSATVSGGNTTLRYQTTAGHFYHVESTASLSPAVWTPVAGSSTNATGASVTFTFPAGSAPLFYRTVSP